MRSSLPFDLRCGFLVLSLLALAGCGGQRTWPVNGTAKLKNGGDVGQLKGHTVSFEQTAPGPDGKTSSATGEIDADGKFQLSTNATNDGAFPGKYRVAVTPPIGPVDGPKAAAVIHPKHQQLGTSGIEITIEPKSNAVVIELEPARP
ncbi:hypothetical protein [Anatilimnocola floriformis]|uniref:hypothetical protein n=1 Tax=Anatilimnocola floriformis TaxID=2948575 RepID=UPI0020C1F68E|nr:hypothetical protein [Anatilimnocola floriformis]